MEASLIFNIVARLVIVLSRLNQGGFMTKTFSFLLLFMSMVGAHASDDHSLSTIQGTSIDLKVYDHAFAGSIKDFVVFGVLDEESFVSELIMRKDGQTIKSEFSKKDNQMGGTIRHWVDSKELVTSIRFIKLVKEENKLLFQANDKEFPVFITSEGFANNHFENPTYRVVINEKEISFTLKGKACFGYSLHLIFMIIGAYLH